MLVCAINWLGINCYKIVYGRHGDLILLLISKLELIIKCNRELTPRNQLLHSLTNRCNSRALEETSCIKQQHTLDELKT